MIEFFNVISAHHQTTSLIFELLSAITIEKACVEWNFVINSENLLKKR